MSGIASAETQVANTAWDAKLDVRHGPRVGSVPDCGDRFRIRLTHGLAAPRRYNFSLCRICGAAVVVADLGTLIMTAGKELLRLYRFNTMQAEHSAARAQPRPHLLTTAQMAKA